MLRKKEIDPNQPEKSEKGLGEVLDSLNMEVRQRGPRETPKHIEARIEEAARSRRATEKPISSGFKRT